MSLLVSYSFTLNHWTDFESLVKVLEIGGILETVIGAIELCGADREIGAAKG